MRGDDGRDYLYGYVICDGEAHQHNCLDLMEVKLVESGFHNHFDLPSTVQASEMQNTFPQSEDCWGAQTAESWATYSLRQGQTQYRALQQWID